MTVKLLTAPTAINRRSATFNGRSHKIKWKPGKYEYIVLANAILRATDTTPPSGNGDNNPSVDTAPDSLSESVSTDNQSAGDTVTTASVESVPAKFEVGKSYLTRGQHLYKPLQVKVIERGEHYIIVQKFEESYISDSECKIFTDKDGNEYAVIYKSNQIELAEVVSAKYEVESIQQSAGIFASYIAAYDSLVAFIETYDKTLSTKDNNLGKHLKGYRKIARLYKDSAAMVGKSEQPLTGKFEIGGIYPLADICYTVIKRTDKFITFESISNFSAVTGIDTDKKKITRKAVSYNEGHEVVYGVDGMGRLDSMVDLDVYEACFHCRRISDLDTWEIPANAYKNAEFVTVADDYDFDNDAETIDVTAEFKPSTLMIPPVGNTSNESEPTDNQSAGVDEITASVTVEDTLLADDNLGIDENGNEVILNPVRGGIKIKDIKINGESAIVTLENSDITAECYIDQNGNIAHQVYVKNKIRHNCPYPEGDDNFYTVLNLMKPCYATRGIDLTYIHVCNKSCLQYAYNVDDPIVAKGLAEHGLTLEDIWTMSNAAIQKLIEYRDNTTPVKIKKIDLFEDEDFGTIATVVIENSDIIARCCMNNGIIEDFVYLIGIDEYRDEYTVLDIDLRQDVLGTHFEGRKDILIRVSDYNYLKWADSVNDPIVAKGLAEHGLTIEDIWTISNAAIEELIEYRDDTSDNDNDNTTPPAVDTVTTASVEDTVTESAPVPAE